MVPPVREEGKPPPDLPVGPLRMNVHCGRVGNRAAGCVTGLPVAKKKTSIRVEDAALPVAAQAQAETSASSLFGPREAAALIEAGRLDVAAGLAFAVLDRRAVAGDKEAAAVAVVLRAHQAALAGLPPLHDAPRRLPRANERGVTAFTELLALLRLQDGQLAELQTALAELT